METLSCIAGYSKERQVPDMIKLGPGSVSWWFSGSPCLWCLSCLKLNVFVFIRWLLSEQGYWLSFSYLAWKRGGFFNNHERKIFPFGSEQYRIWTYLYLVTFMLKTLCSISSFNFAYFYIIYRLMWLFILIRTHCWTGKCIWFPLIYEISVGEEWLTVNIGFLSEWRRRN